MERICNLRLVKKDNAGIGIHFWSEKISEKCLCIKEITFHDESGEIYVYPESFLFFHIYKHIADVHITLPKQVCKCLFVRFLLVDVYSKITERVQLPLDGSDPLYNDDIPTPKKKRRVPPCQP